eukprot:5190477-Lingulodinium_polyedra.AAC.1
MRHAPWKVCPHRATAMIEPSLKTRAQTAQIPVVGRIESCASGAGNAAGPCDATDTLFAGKLSSTPATGSYAAGVALKPAVAVAVPTPPL